MQYFDEFSIKILFICTANQLVSDLQFKFLQTVNPAKIRKRFRIILNFSSPVKSPSHYVAMCMYWIENISAKETVQKFREAWKIQIEFFWYRSTRFNEILCRFCELIYVAIVSISHVCYMLARLPFLFEMTKSYWLFNRKTLSLQIALKVKLTQIHKKFVVLKIRSRN